MVANLACARGFGHVESLWERVDSCSGAGRQIALPGGCGLCRASRRPDRRGRVGREAGFGSPQRVEDGRVIAAAVETADLGQREVCQTHGSGASRPGGREAGRRSGWGRRARHGRGRRRRSPLLDLLGRGWPRRQGAVVGDQLGDQLRLERPRLSEAWAMTRVRAPSRRRTLASMRPASSRRASRSAELDAGLVREAPQDGQPRREVGRLDGDGQAPLEAVAQASRPASTARAGCGRRRGRAGCRSRTGR